MNVSHALMIFLLLFVLMTVLNMLLLLTETGRLSAEEFELHLLTGKVVAVRAAGQASYREIVFEAENGKRFLLKEDERIRPACRAGETGTVSYRVTMGMRHLIRFDSAAL